MLHCTDEAQRGRNSAVCICISGLLVSWRVTETALSAVAPSACAYLFDAADIAKTMNLNMERALSYSCTLCYAIGGREGACVYYLYAVCVLPGPSAMVTESDGRAFGYTLCNYTYTMYI